ncbi:hypothetical protein [Geomonas agri]|uniref:hypothetical protein n=1 Tax=Geomonas agri TaxID=2873702 RepID=UPI001CD75307|nr:hypothetical protein [Geomonas agri]
MRVILMFAALSIATVTAAAPSFAETKDECLLASKNCVDQVDDIYKRIQRLNQEIEKGTRVYTPQELKQLQEKLTETQQMLHDMEKPGR